MPVRNKTPTNITIENKQHSFPNDHNYKHSKQKRNREAIRTKQHNFNIHSNKPQIGPVSPKATKVSPKHVKSPKWAKSPKNSSKEISVYDRKPSKSYIDQNKPFIAEEINNIDEKPRRLSNYRIQSVFESDQREELERVKKANRELKDTIEKLMKNHLEEKKRMVDNIEKLTTDYDKYAKFYRDNFERLSKFNEQRQEPLP